MSALFRDTPAPPAKRDPATGTPHSRYPAEVRERVAQEAYALVRGGMTTAQAARHLDVPPHIVRDWIWAEVKQLWLDRRLGAPDIGAEA